MPWLKNNTDKTIVQMHGGVNFTFPAGESVHVESHDVASWFVGKLYRPASPADGRMEAYCPLSIVVAPEPKTEPVAAKQAVMSLLSPQPTPGHVHPGDPEGESVKNRRAINALTNEDLVSACKRHGVYRKNLDRPHMVEKLAAIGFKPAK